MATHARVAWWENARGLGLEPCVGPGMLRLHAGNALVYGQLKQMVVPATSPVEPPGCAFWARGAWGVEVMVGIPYGSETVAGSAAAEMRTVVMARVDPPLFLGLREIDPALAARVFSMPLRVEAALPAQAKAMADRLADEGCRAYDAARGRGADVSIADTYVGDEAFDRVALVKGEPDEDAVRAVLTKDAVRAALLDVLDWAGGVTIGGGAVWAHADVVPVGKTALERVLREIVAIANALSPRSEPTAPYR